MLINAAETQISAFHAHNASGGSSYQRSKILEVFHSFGGNWSIGEIATYLKLDKSAASGRINELLKMGLLITLPKRRDLISKVLIRPVALPQAQRSLSL